MNDYNINHVIEDYMRSCKPTTLSACQQIIQQITQKARDEQEMYFKRIILKNPRNETATLYFME